jgi:hypothetical protein
MIVLWIYGAGFIIALGITIFLIFKRIKDKKKEDFERRKY